MVANEYLQRHLRSDVCAQLCFVESLHLCLQKGVFLMQSLINHFQIILCILGVHTRLFFSISNKKHEKGDQYTLPYPRTDYGFVCFIDHFHLFNEKRLAFQKKLRHQSKDKS